MLDKKEVKESVKEAAEVTETADGVKATDEKETEAVETATATKETEAVETTAAEKETEAVETTAAEEENAVIEKETEPQPQVIEKDVRNDGYRSEINGVEVEVELQYRDRETDMKDIAKRVTEDYTKRGNDAAGIELIQVYLKPTDFTAYYVINNTYEGKIPLFQ